MSVLLVKREWVFLGLSSQLALRTACRHLLPPEIWKWALVPAFSIFQRSAYREWVLFGCWCHLPPFTQKYSHTGTLTQELEIWRVSSVLDRRWTWPPKAPGWRGPRAHPVNNLFREGTRNPARCSSRIAQCWCWICIFQPRPSINCLKAWRLAVSGLRGQQTLLTRSLGSGHASDPMQ